MKRAYGSVRSVPEGTEHVVSPDFNPGENETPIDEFRRNEPFATRCNPRMVTKLII